MDLSNYSQGKQLSNNCTRTSIGEGEYIPSDEKCQTTKKVEGARGPIFDLLVIQSKLLTELESEVKETGIKFKTAIRENQDPTCAPCDKIKDYVKSELEEFISSVNNRIYDTIDTIKYYNRNCAL